MGYLLDQAYENASNYGRYVSDAEYYELLRMAQYNIDGAQKARNAFANAKYLRMYQSWDPFQYVRSRDYNREESYATLGSNTFNSGGCFITSACMKHMQEVFDDHCFELEILRSYRDSYMKEHHPEEIERYYLMAPQIVSVIDKLEECEKIYQKIYEKMVLPSVKAVKRQEYEKAYHIYADGCRYLNDLYGGE